MRVHGICHTCLENKAQLSLSDEGVWIALGDVGEDGLYIGECPRGHRIAAVLQLLRHELLFDSACLALLDGYHREAIASFAASLERFYEFCVRVFCRHSGIGVEHVDAAWRHVAVQSERQLGAFHFLYLAHSRQPYWGEDQKLVTLRNGVVHKGRFASRADATRYGAHVYSVITRLVDELRETASEALNAQATQEFFSTFKGKIAKGMNVQTIGPGTCPISIVNVGLRPSFDEALSRMAIWSQWVHPANRLSVVELAREMGLTTREFVDAITSDDVRRFVEGILRREEAASDPSTATGKPGTKQD
jgi:hypothetical protein